MTTDIFVFGSNLAGRHGRGAAKFAKDKRGAIYGQGHGLQGQSYAIPTKDKQLRVLPLSQIKIYVAVFLRFARENPTLTFELTPVGCGLAGYQYGDIGPMFADAPPNVKKPKEFL